MESHGILKVQKSMNLLSSYCPWLSSGQKYGCRIDPYEMYKVL